MRGIHNLGNTCFMNSCLQIMCYTPQMIQIINQIKIKFATKGPTNLDEQITKEWSDFYTLLTQTNTFTAITPQRFLYFVQHISRAKKCDLFTGFSQNDVGEFLLFLLECLHQGLNQPVHMRISGEIVNDKDKIAMKCLQLQRDTYKKDYSLLYDIFYGIYVTEITSVLHPKHTVKKPEMFSVIELPLLDELGIPCPNLMDCFEQYTRVEKF